MALNDFRDELAATAAALATPGTGLLAADESTGTIGKRFAAIGLENSEEHRRAYRSLLATTEGLNQHISGVILYEETLFQNSSAAAGGTPLVELFQQRSIVPGIKVDQGVEPLAGGVAGERLVHRPQWPGRGGWPATPARCRSTAWCRSWNRRS